MDLLAACGLERHREGLVTKSSDCLQRGSVNPKVSGHLQQPLRQSRIAVGSVFSVSNDFSIVLTLANDRFAHQGRTAMGTETPEGHHPIKKKFNAIGGPSRNPSAKKIRVLCPHRAANYHGARQDGPIIGIAYRNSLECLHSQAFIDTKFQRPDYRFQCV